VDYKDY
jgi:hypothetical protein